MLCEIPIPEFPKKLSDAIREQVRFFSVTMVVDGNVDRPYTCAGTLSTVAGVPGIIRARHVWEQLKQEAQIHVLAGDASISIDPTLISATVPLVTQKLLDTDADVPDVAFLQIPEHERHRLQAFGKVFYSVDRRRADTTVRSCERQGYWLAYGAPQRKLDPSRGAAPSYLYATSIADYTEGEPWDYLAVHLDLDANPDLPSDLEGFSGGGVWCADWSMKDGGAIHVAEPVLKGVNFWQTARDNRKIVAHGPRSIYVALCDEVLRAVA